MKSIVALSSLALVSLSSIAPCLAVNQALGRLSDQSLSSQSLPSAARTVKVAGFGLNDVFQTIDRGRNIVEQEEHRKAEEERKAQLEKERQERLEAQKKQQEERAAAAKREAEIEAAREATLEKQRLSTQPSTPLRQNNSQSADNLHQVLKKRGNETYEQWYKRINPIILRTSRAEYRAWNATLSVQDRQAYDTIVRRKNREAADTFDQMLPGIIRDAAASQDPSNRPRECWRSNGRGGFDRC